MENFKEIDGIRISSIESVSNIYERGGKYCITIDAFSGNQYTHEHDTFYKAEEKREKILHCINNSADNGSQKEKGKKMMDSIKKYYKDHEDVLFPLLVVIVLDHFFNSGELRSRIVQLAQSLLDGVQTKLLPEGKKNDK